MKLVRRDLDLTSVEAARRIAKRKLPSSVYRFIEGGNEDETIWPIARAFRRSAFGHACPTIAFRETSKRRCWAKSCRCPW